MDDELINDHAHDGVVRNENQEIPCEPMVQEFGNAKPGPQHGNHGTAKSQPEQKPTLKAEALQGLPGRIVNTVDPHTEADPAAILVNILVMFGNVIGRSAHFIVEETPHYTNEFAALVGSSSSGRKGQSLSTPKRMFKRIDGAEGQTSTTRLSYPRGPLTAVVTRETDTVRCVR